MIRHHAQNTNPSPTIYAHTHTHTHTHPFNGPFSGTTQVSRYQKGKTNLDFTGARDSEWQWHQLGRMQVCTSLQTDNHASTSPLSFLQAGCPSCHPTKQRQSTEGITQARLHSRIFPTGCRRAICISRRPQHFHFRRTFARAPTDTLEKCYVASRQDSIYELYAVTERKMVSACARTFNRPEYILLSILSTDLLLEINGRKTSLRQFFWDRNTETDMDR